MRESNKNLTALEISQLVRTCLHETLQSGGSLEQCKLTLEVLPSYLLYAICLDPVFTLFNEKNIFLLINKFFKEDAIKEIGCEATTQLMLLPLKTIQEVACGLTLDNKNLKNHLLSNIVLNSSNSDCSLSIFPKTNELLQTCYPELNFTNISEVTNEDLASIKIRCAEDLKQAAIGEQIKLCDSFESAMLCTYCDLDKSEKAFFKFIYPHRNFTDEEMRKQMIPRHQKLRNRIVASKDTAFKLEINNTFLGEKIIEDSACANIDAIRVPFFTVTKACSFSSSYPANETSVPSDNFYECEKRIESLTKEEKKIFCEKPSFFFRNRQQDKLNNSLQVVETLCDRYLGSDNKDELQQTLELIKVSNTTNNITNTSIGEISSSILGQASLLHANKLDSSRLTNRHTALGSTLEYPQIAAIAGASLAAAGAVGGVGYWLFKWFRKPARNYEACNDKDLFAPSKTAESFHLVNC